MLYIYIPKHHILYMLQSDSGNTMAINNREGLCAVQGLTPDELDEIESLAALCNRHEDLNLKLNPDTLRTRPRNATNDFLYYQDRQLVGFLPLFSFNSREGEISGMVHPDYRRQGIFTRLYKAACAECARRGLTKILLIVERASSSGQAFARSLDTRYDHAEYKMVLEDAPAPVDFNQHLHVREARADEISVLKHIMLVSFDLAVQELDWYAMPVLDSPDRRVYIALHNVAYVGQIEVAFAGPEVMIYGFAVLPGYRRRGYGRQILAHTVQTILAAGHERVALEVATENEHALALYQSCGFKVVSCYDYYLLNI